MTFFLDNCISPRVAAMLRIFAPDHPVVALREHFPSNTPDVDWLRAVGGWDVPPFIVTGDGRILRRKAERQALRESGLTIFALVDTWTNAKWNEYAWKIVKAWPTICETAKHNARPAVYEVSYNKLNVVQMPNA